MKTNPLMEECRKMITPEISTKVEQIVANDDCRCDGTQCKKRDSCLRYTDRPEVYWCDDFSLMENNNPCEFYIKNEKEKPSNNQRR